MRVIFIPQWSLIYRLTCPCGQSYVGRTTQKLNKRLGQHRSAMRLGCTTPLYTHLRSCVQTFDSVHVDILERGGGEGKVREKHWIRTLGPSLNAIQYEGRTKKRRKRRRCKKRRVSSFEERYLLEAQRRKRRQRSKRVSSFEERYFLKAQRRFEQWINS